VKITELLVEGYRSLKGVVWRPGDLNVLIGPNGGGKSNLLRLCQLLQAAACGRLAEWTQREGGIIPMLWDGTAEEIKVAVSLVPEASGGGWYVYEVWLVPAPGSGIHRVGSERLNSIRSKAYERRRESSIFKRTGSNTVVSNDRNWDTDSLAETITPEEAVLYAAGTGVSAQPAVRQARNILADLAIYSNFSTAHGSAARQGAVVRHETRLDPRGENFVSVLHTLYTGSRDFKRDVDEAMRAAFGGDFDELVFPPEADQRVQLRVRWKSMSREQSAADLSDGTLRFLQLLTILANPKPPSLIAIDEPETGMHPAMQRIVAALATDAAARTQVVLTTHSPEFLDAFDETVPTVTVVEWDTGEGTTLRGLAGDALAEWVRQFALGEILRTNAAGAIETEEGG